MKNKSISSNCTFSTFQMSRGFTLRHFFLFSGFTLRQFFLFRGFTLRHFFSFHFCKTILLIFLDFFKKVHGYPCSFFLTRFFEFLKYFFFKFITIEEIKKWRKMKIFFWFLKFLPFLLESAFYYYSQIKPLLPKYSHFCPNTTTFA